MSTTGSRSDRQWPDPSVFGWLEYPATPADWEALIQEHAHDPRRREPTDLAEVPAAERPLRRIFEIVQEHDCVTVLIENRYVDPDYRSEYSRHWSRAFKGHPAFARRLHFFARRIEHADLPRLPDDAQKTYLGYSVLRPVKMGAVGRTVIVPPPGLEGAILTLVDDEVQLFGQRLTVRGAPFCQQDGQFLRCAHAAAWMTHYSAYRRGLTGRQLTVAFTDAAPRSLSFDRLVPSQGMNTLELQAAFGSFNLPAIPYDLDHLPDVAGITAPDEPEPDPYGNRLAGGYWDTRLFSIACRHLNGGFPVLVATETDHAFGLVGWTRNEDTTTFIANDDIEGPYVPIVSPFADDGRTPWTHFMVPAPPNVFLSAEMAEDTAFVTIAAFSEDDKVDTSWNDVATRLQNGELRVRTGLMNGSVYKDQIGDRGFDEEVVALVRRDLFLPHYVWVTEIHDPALCGSGASCVVGEAVLDSTSEDSAPQVLLLILPNGVLTFPVDEGAAFRTSVVVPEAWLPLLGACAVARLVAPM